MMIGERINQRDNGGHMNNNTPPDKGVQYGSLIIAPSLFRESERIADVTFLAWRLDVDSGMTR